MYRLRRVIDGPQRVVTFVFKDSHIETYRMATALVENLLLSWRGKPEGTFGTWSVETMQGQSTAFQFLYSDLFSVEATELS